MILTILQRLIEHDEGLRLKPYKDTVGKLTIGVGRNLDDVGISEAEAMVLLANDIARVQSDLDRLIPWWRSLDDVRQEVLVDMGFNLGVPKLATWKNTLGYTQKSMYAAAAHEMLNSQPWASQVGQRAQVLATMMETGQQPGFVA